MNNGNPSRILNKLALGSVQFGLDYGISNSYGQTTQQEVINILELSLEYGINFIDTAYMYGSSEEALGNSGLIEQFKIVSKFPSIETGTKITEYLEKSLSRLRVTSLYGYIAHSADILIKNRLLWVELKNLQMKGVVSKIGFSLYFPEQLKSLLSLGMIPDLVQVPYNVLDRRFEPLFAILKEYRTEIHTRSSFLQGLLLLDPLSLPSYFEPIRKDLISIRGRFTSNEELSGALLYFCANNSMIDRVVVGVNDSNQLIQNIKSILKSRYMDWTRFENINEDILLPFNWPK
jgi:aryl-alcohol dehydrogenase-like predicted oxidoreductase